MPTWIALFRGINVGGKNILPMKELRNQLESVGLKNVRSYIQSGNVVFESGARSAVPLSKKIGDTIQQEHGFRPHLFVFQRAKLLGAIEANPFPEAIANPKSLHFFFLSEPAKAADEAAIRKAKSESERYFIGDDVFYLHAPDGTGRSKLAANAEKYLGVATTARNYRTVEKLLALVDATA